MKDLEQERSRARYSMISLLCSASVIALSIGSDWQRQDAGFLANIGVILFALVLATISGLQLRLLTKAKDGKTARGYLSVGTSRQPLPRWVGLIIVCSVVVVVVLLISIGFDPAKAPWWAYGVIFLFLLSGVFIEVRRLRAMARPSRNLPSAT